MSHEKPPIRTRPRRRLRNSLCLVGVVLMIYYYLFHLPPGQAPATRGGTTSTPHDDGRPAAHAGPHAPGLLANLSLTAAQCEAAFSGLTWPIRDVVAQGPFTLHPGTAPLLGRIRGRQLSVLRAQRRNTLSTEMLASRTAALHQVHRALVTAPADDEAGLRDAHDIVFSLNFQDQPFGTAWAYSRQADPASRPGAADGDADARTFLMPHFSFWAWRLPYVGSVARAAEAVRRVEEVLYPSFAAKIPRAVWRGTAWFNSVHNPRLRQNLLAAARDQPWADVEALRWDTVSSSSLSSSGSSKDKGQEDGAGGGAGGRTAGNALPIEDFCRYKYVLHTEGVTYSGRFQFLQMCASVVLTPPLGWMQHATHLARPLFSNTLPGLKGNGWETGALTRRAWPVAYPPEEANIVFVAPDWSDLGEVIGWLEDHPEVAEGIARRQRETFVDGGYFSPAAETCYWRALIKGWGEVVRVDESELAEIGEGQTFEAFVLTNGD